MEYMESFMNKSSQSVSFSDELFYVRAGFQRIFWLLSKWYIESFYQFPSRTD